MSRAEPQYKFTRKTHDDMFSDRVVKFDRRIEVPLKDDAHLIVVAIGEGSGLREGFGPEHITVPPTALSNPIYLDAEGNGFEANGDTLGHPLPIRIDARKEIQRLIREKAKAAKP